MIFTKKFRVVNLSLWAVPLGFCGLIPKVEYEIARLERVGRQTIIVHFDGLRREYQLPQRNANMVFKKDIKGINSGRKKYKLFRTIKEFDNVYRVTYDHKRYTWDLEIRSF